MIHDNFIYQDNQSAIRLEKTGKQSISKSTRHINIRYYFITYSIMNQESSVEFCPTFNMIGGYFIKAYRDLNSVDSATSFLVPMRKIFQPRNEN